MESGHNDGLGVQREYIVNALANDESLLNNFLQFRQQQQAQCRIKKTGHNVSPYYEKVSSNKPLIHKQLNQSKKMQSRLQVQQDALTPNKRRLNDSAESGGLPIPKQQRSGNEQFQENEIILDAPGDSQQVDTTLKCVKQHKIPFDQVKRAVSNNLSCFYMSFHPTNTDQKVPSAFKAADQVFEYLKQKNVQINRFSFVGWAGSKLKFGVNGKEDYINLISTEEWPTSIMNIPITIEKPKLIPNCFALVIKYVPRGMDYEFVKEEISRSIASIVNLKRIHYSYNRKTDDYRFHVKDLQEYNRALNMRRISIGNVMISITRFLESNKLTYCNRCWCLGHMRNKCLATTARCRICLQEITDIQKHNCSQQPICVQCDGNHHSLSSQCEPIKAYKIQLKEEVDNALARVVIQRSEPTKQVSIFNPDDFPPLSHPNRNNIPVWGSKKLPKHQTTAEYTETTGVLTALNNQLSIMTETNIRMEKKFEEMDLHRKHDAEVLELLQKTMKNTLYSIREVMEIMVNPLCELAKIQGKRKHLPFTSILEELQAGTSNRLSKQVPYVQKEGQTSKDRISSAGQAIQLLNESDFNSQANS
ncbi:unnamed protein product [Rotaria sp. Silwood2]|nr:unnamed protein product [Rotaria sp. Silwood2]CAF3929723.1 unnamed protein product [Rotaria sp. Silwood2]